MKKEKLIINGNAFYEIDLECIEKKKKDYTAIVDINPYSFI